MLCEKHLALSEQTMSLTPFKKIAFSLQFMLRVILGTVRRNAGDLDPLATLTEQHGHVIPREPI